MWSGGTENSSVCTALRNGEIYCLNDNVLIIMFSADIANRKSEILINNLIVLNY